MATKQSLKRLTKEYMMIQANPIPFIVAKPLESNILEWHYVITGPPDSIYAGGEYHGKILFPSEYPFKVFWFNKPPGIKMLTPNGRFKVDFRLCLSMSDYHPDTWNPAWSVATILTGLLSFMLEETETTGSIKTSDTEKRLLARESMAWNRRQYIFKEVFPELFHKEIPVFKTPEPVIISESKEEPRTEQGSLNIKWIWLMLPGLLMYLILLKLSSRGL